MILVIEGSILSPLDTLPEGSYRLPRMSTRAERERLDILQGTLDLLILRTLRAGPAHGHAIAKIIERGSGDVLRVEQGSLYPALYRLEAQGWIKAEEGISETNRKARFYRLTASGRKQLEAETEHWSRITAAINLVLLKP